VIAAVLLSFVIKAAPAKGTHKPPPVVQHKVTLTWVAPLTSADPVIGYHVYRNGGYLATVDPTTYIDTNVVSGATYTYTVRSIDASGIESINSNSTEATIP
jgi:fibronectin type 3 domain-containing protein